MIRAQHLIDLDPKEGISAQLHTVFNAPEMAPHFLERFTTLIADVGDFIVALGGLAEVVETHKSEYGYHIYRIEYLADAPIAEITEEWVLPDQLRLLQRRAQLQQGVTEVLATVGATLESVPPDTFAAKARATMIEAWRLGLRDHVNR